MQNWVPALAFFFLFLSIVLTWRRANWLALSAGSASLSFAVLAGLCDAYAVVIAAAGALLVHFVRTSQRSAPSRVMAIGALIALALALGFHALPGFSPWLLQEAFGRDAARSVLWQFDKGLAALFLLAVIEHENRRDTFARLTVALSFGVLLLLALSAATGLAQWDPAWLAGLPLWVVGNVFLTVVAEEVFFRGLVQGGLTRCLQPHRYGFELALLISAILFAVVHAAWGAHFAIVAGFAGLFYGFMFRRGGLLWAVLAHAVSNALLVCLMRSPLA